MTSQHVITHGKYKGLTFEECIKRDAEYFEQYIGENDINIDSETFALLDRELSNSALRQLDTEIDLDDDLDTELTWWEV